MGIYMYLFYRFISSISLSLSLYFILAFFSILFYYIYMAKFDLLFKCFSVFHSFEI